ncbi:MAG: AraC family transcriptional regulator [Oscillospiraceae bacterium]|nr:AraC family transcriptional regulator [Oscillospiraceae bacterium]
MKLTNYEMYHEGKSHTSSEFPYNTYVCSIPLDFQSVNIHWHDEVEMIVIKKGEGVVSVDLKEYEVCKGDVVFVMSGQLHSIHQLGDSIMEYENILFKPKLLKTSGHDMCWEQFISPLLSATSAITPVIRNNHKLDAYIRDIDTLCDEKRDGYQIAIKGYLYQIMYLLLSEYAVTAPQPSNKHRDKIKTILSYVDKHYAEEISIEEIAQLCYYSKSYFMKFFKEIMGISFVAYLNDFRLEAAANMLRASDDNILEIASACGFDNLSYFNRSFKKKYGVTPGKYRKN